VKIGVEEFVRQKFAEYYHENSHEIKPPTSLERREFGFLLFKDRTMIRHKGFKRVEELTRFLETTIPSDVYHSAAYYNRPDERMEKKGWLGADLIFDVDADHIETPCKNEHDAWTCLSCGKSEKGPTPENCPSCNQQKFEERIWLCEDCLEAAKMETLKLIDILLSDFGFSNDEIVVCFSGHRGYHVHIEIEEVHSLDQLARKEIIDFVRGTGLDATYHGLYEKAIGIRKMGKTMVGPDINDPGWRGRLSRGVYDFLANATLEQLEKTGLRKKTAGAIIEHRESLLKAWQTKAPWDAVRGFGIGAWKKITDYAIKTQGANVDTVVTTDIHRLIRLPATIHGKTGLKAVKISVADLESFDPLSESVAFTKGTMTINVSEAPKFRLSDQFYGPYERQKVELPTSAAMLLLLKGCATLGE